MKNKLPEKYCIKVNGAGKDHPFIKYLNEKYNLKGINRYDGSALYYAEFPSESDFHNANVWGAIELTLEQFLEATQNNMENRKIIGYKAPYDMYGGAVRKDDLYIIDAKSNPNVYYPSRFQTYAEAHYIQQIPKEIVETWEPVYEEEEKIMLDGSKYEIKVFKPHCHIEGYDFDLKFWEAAKIVSNHPKAAVVLGCNAKAGTEIGGCGLYRLSNSTINKVLDKLK